MNLIEAIREADRHLMKEEISANAILIDKNFAKTNEIAHKMLFQNTIGIIKPSILGYKVCITEDLPDDVAFAITKLNEEQLITDEEKRIRTSERQKTIDEICTWLNDRAYYSEEEALVDEFLEVFKGDNYNGF